MAFYLSPLVAIQEVDLSTTIPAVATSIAGIVIRNPWKGKEGVRQYTTSSDELIDTWGKPTENVGNYRDMLSGDGFHLYGNALWSVGVRPDDATFAGLISTSLTTGPSATFTTPAISGSSSLTLADFSGGDVDTFADEFNPVGDLDFVSIWRGSSANRIRIGIVSSETYNTMVRQKGLTTWPINPYVLSVDSSIEATDTKSFLVLVQHCAQGNDVTDANQWDLVELFNVSTDLAALDSQGLSKFCETVINTQSKFIRVSLKEALKNQTFTCSPIDWLQFGGGYDGDLSADLTSQIIEAYQMFENPEEIDINIIIDADKSETVKQTINQIAIDRMDCMGIVDCKYEHVVNNKGSEATSLVNYRLGLAPFIANNLNINSDRLAAYGNWLEVYDRWNKKYRWIPASGYMAGLWANNDDVSEPWFAPAGLNRAVLTGAIRRLAWNPTLGQRDLIYKNGWNPICSFAGQGKVVWGQKTLLDKSSAFNRINVRRLFIVIEKASATAAKYFLFEQNDAFTRSQLKNMLEPFLRDVQGRRGIYAFSVVCSEENNTPERVDRGELWCDIIIQPTRTAEVIVLRFTATRTGASFAEIAQQLNG